ncbi:MAG: hypothetical protein JXB34_06860 [Bacteroidales bacterium]|nr:hypothetical protein [Bacteroidales bacterium]
MCKPVKIAIITPPLWGHTYPTIAIGEKLIEMGYGVCWISMLDYLEYVLPKHARYIQLPGNKVISGMIGYKQYGMQSICNLYEDDLLPLNRHMHQSLSNILEREKFDAVITDQQAFAGAIAAFQHNIPFVTSVTAPAAIDPSNAFPEVLNFEKSKIVLLQKQLGISLNYPLVCSSPLTLVYSSEYFLGGNVFPESYKFIGPSINNRSNENWELPEQICQNRGRQKILVTMGSVLNRESLFIDKIIEAYNNENIEVILVADPTLRENWPDNFWVFPYISQMKVLEQVDAVICHGGQNTVSEALSLGLPVMVIPVAYDQSYVATKLVNSGAGIRLKYKRLTTRQLKAGLYELLENNSVKQAAQKVKESFDTAGGAQAGAKLVHKFICRETEGRASLNKNLTDIENG